MELLPAPEELDPEEPILRYLIELPGVFLSHSGTTLFHHLLGTYRVLKSWKCHENVCVAGLFHSIYGTPAYRPGPLPEGRRTELRAIIGVEAEALVYLFSRLDWKCLLSKGDRNLQAQSPDILMLAAANLMEQGDRLVQLSGGDLRVRKSLAAYTALLPHLTPDVAAQVKNELAKLRHEP